MKYSDTKKSRKKEVIFALSLVAIAALLLLFRILPGENGVTELFAGEKEMKIPSEAPQAFVPEPAPVEISKLKIPCWPCLDSEGWSIDFQTDLDLIAPLGKGETNAADWFKAFTKPIGPRYDEAVTIMKRRVKVPGELGFVLPADDPLLLEAEPWCDMATMKFYPEIFPIEGFKTRIPNLLISVTLAKSWVARGVDQEDIETGLEDCRRTVRLGRLLRQDDVTIIADLVGLACIRFGVQGIYDLSIKKGDQATALAASIILGEIAPQRLLTSKKITEFLINDYLSKGLLGNPKLQLSEERFDTLMISAGGSHDRRFLGEAFIAFDLIQALGTREQKEKVNEFLEKLIDSGDELTAHMARYCLDTPLTEEELKEYTLNYS